MDKAFPKAGPMPVRVRPGRGYDIGMEEMEEKEDWKALAGWIAAENGWVSWIESSCRYREGVPGPVVGYEASFKVGQEHPRCPHCGKGLPLPAAESEFVYVSRPRNYIYWDEDEDAARKALVESWLKTVGMTVEELKIRIEVKGTAR